MIGALLAGFATNPWARTTLRYGAIVLAVLLFLFALRRSGERTGRLAERLETLEETNDVQRRMLDAAARRPRDRDELADRLRNGRFVTIRRRPWSGGFLLWGWVVPIPWQKFWQSGDRQGGHSGEDIG